MKNAKKLIPENWSKIFGRIEDKHVLMKIREAQEHQ